MSDEEELIGSWRRDGPGPIMVHPADDPEGPEVQIRKWAIEKALECTKEPGEMMLLAQLMAAFVLCGIPMTEERRGFTS